MNHDQNPYAAPPPVTGGGVIAVHPYAAPPPSPHGVVYGPRPSQAPLVMSIIALVLAALAVLGPFVGGALFAGVMQAGGEEFFAPQEISGQVAVTDGAVSGSVLSSAITRQAQEVMVGSLSCPDATGVRQGMTIVCREDVDGMAWTYLVVFADAEGRYDVVQY